MLFPITNWEQTPLKKISFAVSFNYKFSNLKYIFFVCFQYIESIVWIVIFTCIQFFVNYIFNIYINILTLNYEMIIKNILVRIRMLFTCSIIYVVTIQIKM